VNDADAGLAWEILQRYADPATAEFDAAVDAAHLPDDVARALRFWHRQSVANVKQFAAEVLPTVFAAVATGQRDAADATRRAGAAYDAGRGPRTPGESPWALPREQPREEPRVITLPEPETSETIDLLEERRRTVAARLAELG
jgi:hypothetical protein